MMRLSSREWQLVVSLKQTLYIMLGEESSRECDTGNDPSRILHVYFLTVIVLRLDPEVECSAEVCKQKLRTWFSCETQNILR